MLSPWCLPLLSSDSYTISIDLNCWPLSRLKSRLPVNSSSSVKISFPFMHSNTIVVNCRGFSFISECKNLSYIDAKSYTSISLKQFSAYLYACCTRPGISEITQEPSQAILHSNVSLCHSSSTVAMHNCCALLSSLANATMILPLTEPTPRTNCGVLWAFSVRNYVGNFIGISVYLLVMYYCALANHYTYSVVLMYHNVPFAQVRYQ
jgi:hypothetical protein